MTSLLGTGLPGTHSIEGVWPGCEKVWAALMGQGEGGWREIHYCTSSRLLELLAAPSTPPRPTPGIQTLCPWWECVRGNGMFGYLALDFSEAPQELEQGTSGLINRSCEGRHPDQTNTRLPSCYVPVTTIVHAAKHYSVCVCVCACVCTHMHICRGA